MAQSEELGREINLAASSGSLDPVLRSQKRLSQSRVPTSQNLTQNWVNWESMEGVLGQPFNSQRIPLSKLEQMRLDNMLALGLSLCKVPLVRAPWYIKSSDAQRAAFIDGALRRIYGRLILAYTNSFDFGYSAIVKRFEYAVPDWTYVDRDDVGSDDPTVEKPVWPDTNVNALLWKPFLALSPRLAIPHWNAAGDFAGIDIAPHGGTPGVGAFGSSGMAGFPFMPGLSGVAQGKQGRPADIPLDWCLWATNQKDSVFGSYWGRPRLAYAYRFWWSYWYKFALADRAFEKWADPPVKVYYPADNAVDEHGEAVDFADVALQVAEELRSGANVAMPSSVVRGEMDKATSIREWEAEQMDSTANFVALNDTFEYLDVMKLRSMMVPEQAVIEGKGGTSSRNVAATMGDMFQESQSVVMQEIDDIINRYMIPQLLEANFGPGGATCEKVTTGFDPQDVETARLIITGTSNTAPGTLPVDMRELLNRLGMPLLTHAAYATQLKQAAEQAAKLNPPPIKPDSSGNAGVTKAGLYEQQRDVINLDQPIKEDEPEIEDDFERHIGLMEKFFDLFRRHEKEIEPQEVKVTFDVEMAEPTE